MDKGNIPPRGPDRRRLEGDLEPHHAAPPHAALNALGQKAVGGLPFAELVDQALSDVQELLGADASTIAELDSEGRLVLQAVKGMPERFVGERLRRDKVSLVAQALNTTGPLLVYDWRTETRFSYPVRFLELELLSTVSAPVRTSDLIVGVLGVHSRQPSAFAEEDVDFVQAVAHVLGQAFERRAETERLRRQSLVDVSTGLPNRQSFADRVDAALRVMQPGGSVAVVLLDLDRFSLINNTLGERAGNDVLLALIPRLRERLGEGDALARVSAGRFAVLRQAEGEILEMGAAARSLLDAVEKPILVDHSELRVTASTGVAVAAERVSAADLIRDAEAALHRAKERGGARVQVFDDAIRSELIERVRIEHELRRALATEELLVYYQPVFSLQDRRVVSMEALIRWQHPAWGLVLPGRFLSIAEDSELIGALGRRILREACHEQALWAADYPDRRAPTVAVNVAPWELTQRGFAGEIAEALEYAGIAPNRLVLEITERTLLEEPTETARTLDELRALGVRMYLDDFGTGYSSLSYLKRFAVDGLKLDGAFVADLPTDQQMQSIVEAIIGVAQALGLHVIAEGVETEEQVTVLQALGCDVAQGYLFARPGPPREFGRLLERSLPGAEDPAVQLLPLEDASTASQGPEPATVTLSEAASALGVSPSTIRRWSDGGRLATARTAGGHRRIHLDDVRRLRAATRGGAGEVRAAALPKGAHPIVADILQHAAAASVTAALKATYTGTIHGWFADDEGVAAIDEWLKAVGGAFSSGGYSDAIDATRSFMRRAKVGGATALERVVFLERFGRVLARALGQDPSTRDAIAAVDRLWATLRHRALEDFA